MWNLSCLCFSIIPRQTKIKRSKAAINVIVIQHKANVNIVYFYEIGPNSTP